ncbi:MAG: DNA-binding protein [Deltaproteobacteria bacterium]|nr:DNA-binding protein [Deltaproteobacteria bacterium]
MAGKTQKAKQTVYFAVIGDLVESRKIADRRQFQQYFMETLGNLNSEFAQYIASKFTVTTGDEFQGVLNDASSICHLMDSIIAGLYPRKLRFGIGVGGLNTALNPELSVGADGPAYWAARSAIEYIHDHNDYGSSRIYLQSAVGGQTALINTALAANSLILEGWRDTQMEVLQALIRSGLYGLNYEQVKLAEQMKLSPAALQKRIKGSGINIYLRNGAAISEAIHQLGRAA